jgi:type II secretory pathway component PulC
MHPPGGVDQALRLDTAVKNGRPYGIRMTYLDHSSFLSRVGLRQGDVLLSINGEDLVNQDDAIRAYRMLQRENPFDFKIERHHQMLHLYVEIK